MHAYAHAHRHTAVFVRREDTFLRPLWTLTKGEIGGGVWRNHKRNHKKNHRASPVVDLACADVRELSNPDGSEVTRASLHPITVFTGVSEPGQNQERFWTPQHNMLSWPLSWPGTWGDDAGGRRDVFALPAVCTEPALLGENLIIDHWSTWNKAVSKRRVPVHALIEDCGVSNADWFGGGGLFSCLNVLLALLAEIPKQADRSRRREVVVKVGHSMFDILPCYL